MSGTNQQEQQNAVPQNPPSQNAPPQNPTPQANQPGPQRPKTQRGSSNSEAEDYPTEKRMVAVGALGIFAGAAVGVAVGLHQGKKAAGAVTPVTTLSKDQLKLLQSVGQSIGDPQYKPHKLLLNVRILAEVTLKEMVKTNSIEVLQKKNGKIQPFTFLTADFIFHDVMKTFMEELTSTAVGTNKKELTDLVQTLDTMRKEHAPAGEEAE